MVSTSESHSVGGGSTCSEAPEVLDVVVYEAEDSNAMKVLRSIIEDLHYVSLVLLGQHRA